MMDNIPETMIPYSTKAIEGLLAIEKEHHTWNWEAPYNYDPPLCASGSCTSMEIIEINTYPCHVLNRAREISSKETLVAVALLLSGDVNE